MIINNTSPLAKKIALGFGIAVVFPMLIHYGVSTFVYSPKWWDYRPQPSYEYKVAEKHFQQRLFTVAVPLGLIALVAGAFLRLPALGTGLMFGGIFSASDGYFNYWSELADVLKFVSLLVTFTLLVFLAYRRLETKEAKTETEPAGG